MKRVLNLLRVPLALLLFGGVVVLAASQALAAGSAPGLEVHFLNVGQGDAALIRTAEGKTVLIDTGTPEGGEVVTSHLKALGIKELNLLVLTHPHLDHIGGAIQVLMSVKVKAVLDPKYPHTTQAYTSLLQDIEARVERGELNYYVGYQGRKFKLGESATIEILSPPREHLPGERSPPNTNSIVALLTHGAVRFLFTGDAEAETERFLLREGGPLRAEVLKVSHHGSRYSTSAAFLVQVRPEVAIISAGRNNRYGHPHRETLSRLDRNQIKIYRTDLNHHIRVKSDGKKIEVETDYRPPVARATKPASRATAGGGAGVASP